MEVLAVIPARAGSKSVPHKNIREIGGKPMMAYSIEHALASAWINRVIVSTDSEEYAKIALRYGAEVPFLRPAEYATDTALDYDVFLHALTWLRDNEQYEPDVVVQLRPTYPVRNVNDIDAMIQMLIDNPEADAVRSMSRAQEIPYKMWLVENAERKSGSIKEQSADCASGSGRKNDNHALGLVTPLMTDIPECYNMPRQQLPTVYYQNACIDVFRPEVVLKKGSMSGDMILGYEMTENFDIDTEDDLKKAMKKLEER